ncbi:MAG: protein kinase [Verrucomicrobiota bacterium]
MKTIRLCPGCGNPLPADAPAGLCPQCLLKSESPTLNTEASNAAASTGRTLPIPGQRFGCYQILRLLGQGGMGEVFEAAHIESERRVALKVMSHALGSDQDRKRFLREGRLAASVNHPNVVYIHGSEEIEGMPVITMELVHGGTLKDRLKREGPLPVSEAVEIALQLIGGLEAAHEAGVLHRDIKPGNCFVAADGTVKVGDFGLSVSTLARGESLLTATGTVMGTPAYASPEQLRGEELDVRSDIYSVGATLYHLITGKPPFPATDFVKLIAEVLDKPATSPQALRSDLPAALSKLLLRCLAKDRKARFQSYAEFRDALLPFREAEAVPATPARRFLAGLMDDFIAYGPSMLFLVYRSFDPLDVFVREQTLHAAMVWAPFFLFNLSYYAVAEGLWGAAIGKSLCGIQVVGPTRQAPGIGRAALRALIYLMPYTLPYLFILAFVPLSRMHGAGAENGFVITDWLWLPLMALLFVTMRRHNGYAALQDLASGTRVIVKPRTQPRPRLGGLTQTRAGSTSELPKPPPLVSGTGGAAYEKVGPYEIRESLWKTSGEELLLAYDPALRRQIWIHLRPKNATPISAERRDLSRPGRLRWLMGGQSEAHLWDAYDAVDGQPLLGNRTRAHPWKSVRFWLLDLANELGAATNHAGVAPVLSLDRVWLSSDGRALLLDFPAPGLAADSTPPASSRWSLQSISDVQDFLSQIARLALRGRVDAGSDSHGPLPEPAQVFLTSLAKRAFEKIEFITGNLHSLNTRPAEVTRPWRAASLVLVPTVLLLLAVSTAGMVRFERIRLDRAWTEAFPDKPPLVRVSELYMGMLELKNESQLTDRQLILIRIYLAHHFGDLITNEVVWARPELSQAFPNETRALLKSALANLPPITPEDLQVAEHSMKLLLQESVQEDGLMVLWIVVGVVVAFGGLFALLEFLAAVCFGQSLLLRLFGLTLVDVEGQPAKRLRLVWRWIVSWGAVGLLVFIAAGMTSLAAAIQMSPGSSEIEFGAEASAWIWLFGGGALIVWLGAVIHAVLHPQRSFADYLAGTCIVPR